MMRRLLRWRPRRKIAKRLRAEGFARYDRADFTPGTQGARGWCRRGHLGLQPPIGEATWQIRRANGHLFAYCEAHAWDVMVEIRAKRIALRLKVASSVDAILDAPTVKVDERWTGKELDAGDVSDRPSPESVGHDGGAN